MSVCCIGGVCIPYTAIVPLLLLGLKWLAEKLARLGLLPDFVVQHLGLAAVAAAQKERESSCCDTTNTTASSSTSLSNNNKNSGKLVHSVESMEDWTFIKQNHEVIVVKFTAAWCRPCKEVAPVFTRLSEKYENAHFVQVDVDELDDVASEHNVAVMPTFVVLKQGTAVSTMRGSNPQKLTSFVEEHVSSVSE